MPFKFNSSDDEDSPRSSLSSTKEKMKALLPTSKHHRSSTTSSNASDNSFLPPNPTMSGRNLEPTHYHNHPNPPRTSHQSTHSAPASTAASRSTTANSTFTGTHAPHHHRASSNIRDAVLRAQEVTPTSEIAEWAHQMHLMQRKSFWWCQGCFPKTAADPLEIPRAVEKMIESRRRVRIVEPATAYD